MMGFKPVKEPKTERFYVRFSETELDSLREKAEQCGMTMSQYARDAALGKRIVPKTDYKMLAELRRQGGSLRERLSKLDTPEDRKIALETIAAFRDIVHIIDKAIDLDGAAK